MLAKGVNLFLDMAANTPLLTQFNMGVKVFLLFRFYR